MITPKLDKISLKRNLGYVEYENKDYSRTTEEHGKTIEALGILSSYAKCVPK